MAEIYGLYVNGGDPQLLTKWVDPLSGCGGCGESLGILAHLLRMVSWTQNTMRLGGDWTP